ncbi:hypothetical protein [Agrococcus casei]|uniref:hypothetical protein n=1 Tax=Agrococcus casei TaxID=343512 RepID=UPI003F8FC457
MSTLTAEDRQTILNHLAHEALDVLTDALKHNDPHVRIAAAGTILDVASITPDEQKSDDPAGLTLDELRAAFLSLDSEAHAAAFDELRRRGIIEERDNAQSGPAVSLNLTALRGGAG